MSSATSASDKELMTRAQTGDLQALEALLSRYQAQLYRFAMRMCRDTEDAREVLQESLLAAARGIGNFRGEAAVSSWLYAIARSFCLKHRRKPEPAVGAQPLESAVSVADPGKSPDDATAERELLTALERAMSELEPNSREVLLLRDVEGLSAAEVASALALSVPQVKSRLHRARAAVRGRLEHQLRVRPPVPAAPAPSDCPDMITTFSRYLEDEISPDMCERMQAHIDACAHCNATCDTLKRTLALCHHVPTPDVPAEIQDAVRNAIRGMS